MATKIAFNYKKEINRYNYYYRRLAVFYQKPVVQVSTAVLFTLTTIIFFAVFAIRPTLQTISELLRKIDDQKQVLTLAEKKSSALATAQQQLDTVSPHLSTLISAIPIDYAAQSLLRDLESTAGQFNIPLQNLKISDLSYPVPTEDSSQIQELTFTISLNAPYPLIKQFTNAILLLPRLISIDTISISTPDDVRQNVLVANTLTGTLKCRTYYLTNQRSEP